MFLSTWCVTAPWTPSHREALLIPQKPLGGHRTQSWVYSWFWQHLLREPLHCLRRWLQLLSPSINVELRKRGKESGRTTSCWHRWASRMLSLINSSDTISKLKSVRLKVPQVQFPRWKLCPAIVSDSSNALPPSSNGSIFWHSGVFSVSISSGGVMFFQDLFLLQRYGASQRLTKDKVMLRTASSVVVKLSESLWH